MTQKTDEINELKLTIEKKEREIKEKELENKTSINAEKNKYSQLEEQYKNEIAEKNARIIDLTKNSNALSLSQISSSGKDFQQIQLESIKNDFNYITDISINYRTLVEKLIKDKEFFFEDILINKTLDDLKNKYPEIFNLLIEKENLDNMRKCYEQRIEFFTKENTSFKEKNNSQLLEISEYFENYS